MAEGETVTAVVKWVNPNHYVEVREQVAALRKALEEAAIALDDIVDAEKSEGRRNSYCASTARRAAKNARDVLLPGEERKA